MIGKKQIVTGRYCMLNQFLDSQIFKLSEDIETGIDTNQMAGFMADNAWPFSIFEDKSRSIHALDQLELFFMR